MIVKGICLIDNDWTYGVNNIEIIITKNYNNNFDFFYLQKSPERYTLFRGGYEWRNLNFFEQIKKYAILL